ncbi:MarR family transcriptional regulator, partial [Xanthomonas citri pv. citri]|nr:MarR family transcriptional regulator [Xanthomonas citri pv. citri]
MMIMSQGGSGRSTNEGATKTCDDVGSQMEKSAATAWLSIEQQRVWRAWLLGS